MADYPRITGTIRPTPRNRVSGFLADLLELGAKGYDAGSTLQAGGPVTEGKLSTPVSDLLGIPELQRTLNRISYNEPLTTGTGYTTKLRPDTLSAAMTVAPMAGPTAKAGATGARMAGTALKDLATSDVAYNAAMNAMRRSGGLAELTGYHGTPHKFSATKRNPLGEFKATQIGSGEGHQAYGHGLYFAENPNVARQYQQTLSDFDMFVDGKPFDSANPAHRAALELKQRGGEIARKDAIKTYAEQIKDLRSRNQQWANDLAKAKEEELPFLKSGKIPNYQEVSKGSFYHVDLPDPMIEKMLHWDRPLGQQSKSVQEALAKFDRDLYHPSGEEYDVGEMGQQIYQRLRSKLGPVKAEAFMQSQGIPGIQYFDEGSRGANKGTRNFVVFPGEEQNLIILKRE
jgi:hypothetical protein